MKNFKDNEEVTYSELYKAYLDCRLHKRYTYNALIFEKNVAENIYKLWIELNSGTYKIGKSIAFCVTKPLKREVFAADFRDRIVHHLVVNRINKYFEADFIIDSYSCRKSKGTLYGIKRLEQMIITATNNYTKEAWIIKCDIKSYFMSIDKAILYDKLDKFITTKSQKEHEDQTFTLKLIKQIIFNNPQDNCIRKQSILMWDNLPKDKSLFTVSRSKGLPIGNLTSQLFGNFYLNDFDHFMKDLLGIKYYGRYVDDFFFIVDDPKSIKDILSKISTELTKIGLKLHPNKTYIQPATKGIKFTGVILKPHRKYIINRTKGSLVNLLKSNQDPEKFISSVNSYLGLMIHYNTYNLRKTLLDKYIDQSRFEIGKNYEKITLK